MEGFAVKKITIYKTSITEDRKGSTKGLEVQKRDTKI